MKNIYGVIPARAGSKGVKGKNIRLLAGKPLIAHTIECARQCDSVKDVIVSTDSTEIAAIAKQYGADIVLFQVQYHPFEAGLKFDQFTSLHAGQAKNARNAVPDLEHRAGLFQLNSGFKSGELLPQDCGNFVWSYYGHILVNYLIAKKVSVQSGLCDRYAL